MESVTTKQPDTIQKKRNPNKITRFLRILGPGIITGAADDDPSGIATYSQAGAQFGFSMPWTMLFTFPLMTAVQEACMRIGAVTGKGLAKIVREYYPKKILYPVVLLVVFANTLNIGSDIGAMAASTQLLMPEIPFQVLAIFFTAVMILLEILIPYKVYVKILKWLVIALFAYFITAFLIPVPWEKVLKATLVPQVQFTPEFLYIIVGIFGTTISPYLFFWETSNVVEDEIVEKRLAQKGGVPRISKPYLKRLRIDTVIGMFFSNITAWFIIIVFAVSLHNTDTSSINSAADAAKALEPLVQSFPNAGYLAKLIFSLGVIGIGLMSVPVLAGASAYAISESLSWKEGLFQKFNKAKGFYLVIIAGMLAGLLINFLGINPIQALILTAVFNGIAAVPLILLITLVSAREDIMGTYKNGLWSKIGLWTAFIVMTVFAVALLISFVK